MYDDEDVDGAIQSIKDELPKLEDRHREACDVFHKRGVADLNDTDECVELLRDEKVRAEFAVRLERFLDTLDVVLPRPEALPFVADAKRFGFIRKAAANLYRDPSLNLIGAGRKVRVPDRRACAGERRRTDRGAREHYGGRFRDCRGWAFVGPHEGLRNGTRCSASYFDLDEDPAYYRKLSERLEEILRTFQDNWAELVKAERIRRGRPDSAGR